MDDTRTSLPHLEQFFKALADTTRLRILSLLLGGEVCVCHIYESLRIPQPKASRHLAYLRRAGLVTTRRDGLWVHYRLADVPDAVLGALRSAVFHALSHVEPVRKDVRRLARKTGSSVPTAPARPAVPCCAPAAASGGAR